MEIQEVMLLVAEESTEVGKVACKIQRQFLPSIERIYPRRKDRVNQALVHVDDFTQELADLLVVAFELQRVDLYALQERMRLKREKMVRIGVCEENDFVERLNLYYDSDVSEDSL